MIDGQVGKRWELTQFWAKVGNAPGKVVPGFMGWDLRAPQSSAQWSGGTLKVAKKRVVLLNLSEHEADGPALCPGHDTQSWNELHSWCGGGVSTPGTWPLGLWRSTWLDSYALSGFLNGTLRAEGLSQPYSVHLHFCSCVTHSLLFALVIVWGHCLTSLRCQVKSFADHSAVPTGSVTGHSVRPRPGWTLTLRQQSRPKRGCSALCLHSHSISRPSFGVCRVLTCIFSSIVSPLAVYMRATAEVTQW